MVEMSFCCFWFLVVSPEGGVVFCLLSVFASDAISVAKQRFRECLMWSLGSFLAISRVMFPAGARIALKRAGRYSKVVRLAGARCVSLYLVDHTTASICEVCMCVVTRVRTGSDYFQLSFI